jgi:hypothetical protein
LPFQPLGWRAGRSVSGRKVVATEERERAERKEARLRPLLRPLEAGLVGVGGAVARERLTHG